MPKEKVPGKVKQDRKPYQKPAEPLKTEASQSAPAKPTLPYQIEQAVIDKTNPLKIDPATGLAITQAEKNFIDEFERVLGLNKKRGIDIDWLKFPRLSKNKRTKISEGTFARHLPSFVENSAFLLPARKKHVLNMLSSDKLFILNGKILQRPSQSLFKLTAEDGTKHRFVKIKNLGEGANGKVMLVQDIDTAEFIVIKRIIKQSAENIKEEVDLLKTVEGMTSTGMQRKGGWSFGDKKDYFAMGLASGMDLATYFYSIKIEKQKPKFKEAQLIKVFSQILEQLIFMHSQGVIHRDIKPENIIIDPKSMSVKVIDLGLAVQLKKGQTQYLSRYTAGTPGYIAPELYHQNKKGKVVFETKCDLYSLGETLKEMLVSDHSDLGDSKIFFEKLQDQLLEKDPKKRIDAVTALKVLDEIAQKTQSLKLTTMEENKFVSFSGIGSKRKADQSLESAPENKAKRSHPKAPS